MKELILIDFSWLYNRYYYVSICGVAYSIKKHERNQEKKKIKERLEHSLLEFLSLIHRSYPEAKIFMALDPLTSTLKNKLIFEGYKQNRDKEAKKDVYFHLVDIIKSLFTKLDPCSFSFLKEKGYEADQLIAFLTQKYYRTHKVIIYSGDKDLLQLTSYPHVFASEKFERGKFIIKTDKEIFEKFKSYKGEDFSRISTNKKDILKYRSLKGDPSDNLDPVFPRIKDKEIAEIIQNHWTDNQDETLTEKDIKRILKGLEESNPELARKLRRNKKAWLRNYQIMDLFHIGDIKIRRLM